MKDFNFFNPYIQNRKKSNLRYVYIIATVAIVGVLLGGTFLLHFVQVQRLTKEIAAKEKLVQSKDKVAILEEREKLKKRVELLQKIHTSLGSLQVNLQGKERINSKLLAEINSTLPEKITFQVMVIEGSVIQIQGTGPSTTAIAELEYNLRKLDIFEKLHFPLISKKENGEDAYIFTATGTLKDVKQDENHP